MVTFDPKSLAKKSRVEYFDENYAKNVLKKLEVFNVGNIGHKQAVQQNTVPIHDSYR